MTHNRQVLGSPGPSWAFRPRSPPGPSWALLGIPGPFWAILGPLGNSGPFGPFWALWVTLGIRAIFGPLGYSGTFWALCVGNSESSV